MTLDATRDKELYRIIITIIWMVIWGFVVPYIADKIQEVLGIKNGIDITWVSWLIGATTWLAILSVFKVLGHFSAYLPTLCLVLGPTKVGFSIFDSWKKENGKNGGKQ